eukprot:jgi/Botrbrau1/8116/Bobra.0308s0011.1
MANKGGDTLLSLDTSVWLRKHGKRVKPKLTPLQVEQLQTCFALMDEDGSGAIDAGELGNAFKLLGIQMRPSEIQAMVKEVDNDGSGELEYEEFVHIMTNILTRSEGSNGKPAAALPFEVTATSYRRKKLIEAMKSGDQEVISSLAAPSSDSTDDAGEAATNQKLDGSRPSMSGRRSLVRTKTLGSTSKGLSAKMEVPLRSVSVPAGFNSTSVSSTMRERLDPSRNELSEGGLRLLGSPGDPPCRRYRCAAASRWVPQWREPPGPPGTESRGRLGSRRPSHTKSPGPLHVPRALAHDYQGNQQFLEFPGNSPA